MEPTTTTRACAPVAGRESTPRRRAFGSRTLALSLAVLALCAGAADAEGKGKPSASQKAPAGLSSSHCPPGLAKKNPPCVPPGQAKDEDGAPPYAVGERILDGWVLVPDPDRYGILEPGTYWRVGDHFFRVDRETGEVLAVLGVLSRLLD